MSTRGKKRSEVSEELVKFLEFVGADLEDSMKDFEDESVPENLKERILNEKDLSILKRWHKMAARVASIEEFMSQM